MLKIQPTICRKQSVKSLFDKKQLVKCEEIGSRLWEVEVLVEESLSCQTCREELCVTIRT